MEHTSSVKRPESGTWHGRVWRWRQQQWEAVQGPMRDSGPGSSKRRRYRGGPMADKGPGSSYGRPVICQHPYDKKWNTPAVCEEDLKVAHGRVWRWRQQQWEPPYRDP
ncbi:unnamed protein product [Staurois parvus]|uniref:Uncharacterized protein n=1 Tax=Staurois parvus TaxID=386267 RepID=A0ABN9CDZ2_9NEOB|nr:unnamed protein product [Staurois parvus]